MRANAQLSLVIERRGGATLAEERHFCADGLITSSTVNAAMQVAEVDVCVSLTGEPQLFSAGPLQFNMPATCHCWEPIELGFLSSKHQRAVALLLSTPCKHGKTWLEPVHPQCCCSGCWTLADQWSRLDLLIAVSEGGKLLRLARH